MNIRLMNYYKNCYERDFNKFFQIEIMGDGYKVVPQLLPKTIGFPGGTPWESIYFASITWFISLIPQVIGVHYGEKAMFHFHKVADWPILLDCNNMIHPFHTLASPVLLPVSTCYKMSNCLGDCESFMLPALERILPSLLNGYNSVNVNKVCTEIDAVTSEFEDKLAEKHRWPWYDEKFPMIYRPFPIYYHKFDTISNVLGLPEASLEDSYYFRHIQKYFYGLFE